MTGFNKVMRFCNTLQDYESAKNQGTITDDLFVVILQDKLAKFKGQTFDWSQNADLTALATKGELEALAEEIASNERVWAEALNDLNERINEIGTGGGGGTSDIVVDAALSTTSTNAIQNKAVANALNEKADASALASKQDTLVSGTNIKTVNGESILGEGNIVIQSGEGGNITVDAALSSTSTNPVQNKVVKAELDKKADTSDLGYLSDMSYRQRADDNSEIVLELGGIATDASESSDTTRARMSGYISAPFAIEVNDGYLIRNVHRYKVGADGNIEHELYAEAIKNKSYSTYNDSYIYRISFNKSDDTAVISSGELGDIIKSVKGRSDIKFSELNSIGVSSSSVFNQAFSEIYTIGFSVEEIASITGFGLGLTYHGDKQVSFKLNNGNIVYMGCADYGVGVRYFGELEGGGFKGSKGFYALVNSSEWFDVAGDFTLKPSCTIMSASPTISQHLVRLISSDVDYNVPIEIIGSKRIGVDGTLNDASSNWGATRPIAVSKGDTLRIHTDGNVSAMVLAKTDASASYYEELISYDASTLDYEIFIDFDGFVAASMYVLHDHYINRVSSPLANAILNSAAKQMEPDSPDDPAVEGGVGIESIEQTTTATTSGGTNVITCVLTDGTQTQFYIKNGKDGNGGGTTVQNFNSVQLLPRTREKKPIIEILPSDAWYQQSESDGTISSSLERVYDEVYGVMRDVKWVKSVSRTKVIYKFSEATNLTRKVICGSIYIDESISNTAHLGELYVRIYSNNALDYGHCASIRIQFAGSGNELYQRTGWFHFCVSCEANCYDKGASFDITQATMIAIHNVHNTATAVSFGIGRFSIVDGLKKGGVVMMIDNFNPNVPAMADYISSKGLKATLSIVPGWIGNDTLHGTLDQINACAAQGHLIVNHTWEHIISNDQTYEDIQKQIRTADEWMISNGFVRGSKIVSNPSAAHDLNKYIAYMDSPAIMIYHHWTTMGSGENFTLYYPYAPMSRLLNITSLESNGVDYMIAAVNKAIEVGGIAVLGWHGTWFDKVNGESDFKRLVDHIASLSNELNCYNVDDLLEGAYY